MKRAKEILHPAALAAESDLVKLTREFESLTSQVNDLDNQIEALREEEREENKQVTLRGQQRSAQIDHIYRERRVLEAQHFNVVELMRNSAQIKLDNLR